MNAGSFQSEVGGNESGTTYLTSAASERKYPPKNFETSSSQDHLDSERDETLTQKHKSSTMQGRPECVVGGNESGTTAVTNSASKISCATANSRRALFLLKLKKKNCR
jgi:hypothetical protein